MTAMLKARYPGLQPPALAWHSGLGPEERLAIKRAIPRRRRCILYCSPPRRPPGALLPALFDAARAGGLRYLVIDERLTC